MTDPFMCVNMNDRPLEQRLKTLIITAFSVYISMQPIYSEPCADCPSGDINIERIVANLADALKNPSANIVIAKKLPDQKILSIIKDGTLPYKFINEQTAGGKFIQIFEVLSGLDQKPKVNKIITFTTLSRGYPRPETWSPGFSPPAGTEWLMIVKLAPIGGENELIKVGEFFDFSNSIFANSPENTINTNADKLLKDLNHIQSLNSSEIDPSSISTGIAAEVAKLILTQSIEKR